MRSVLFLLKKRNQSWGQSSSGGYHSSGLLNSASFVNQMLQREGVRSSLVECVDANCIDREVTQFNPDVVILEAIWCPPEKLLELVHIHRHRHRRWIVRNHSELPFLALEGISMDWVIRYTGIPKVNVACNSPLAQGEICAVASIQNGFSVDVPYLPNYYPTDHFVTREKRQKSTVDVGCFGAVRPLKNHLQQAVAAIIYAAEAEKSLRFHINASRVECNGDPVLKSLKGVLRRGQLVEHPWLGWREFVELCRSMDVGLQVSFSETFNIVSADMVSQGVPVVASDELPWLPPHYHADPTSAHDIAKKMRKAVADGAGKQATALKKYSLAARAEWLEFLR